MTEKELKKLSRLELLELLLDASTENYELKDRIAKLQTELQAAQQIQQLSTAIQQVENVLEQANRLSASINGVATPVAKTPDPTSMDKEVYRCLLQFYSTDADAMSALPLELQYAIKERIPSILDGRN